MGYREAPNVQAFCFGEPSGFIGAAIPLDAYSYKRLATMTESGREHKKPRLSLCAHSVLDAGVKCIVKDRGTGQQIDFEPRFRHELGLYAEREIYAHTAVAHPHILQLYRIVELPETPNIVILVTERVAGYILLSTFLHNRPEPLETEHARSLFQQLVIAVHYCHSRGVAHRDIELENCVLDQTRTILKLSKFSRAKTEEDSTCNTCFGEVGHMAPEVLDTRPPDKYDGQKADAWSLGVVLYTLVVHGCPFAASASDCWTVDTARSRASQLDFPASRPIPDDCKNLIRHLLDKDPHTRYGASDILGHPWFQVSLPYGLIDMNQSCHQRETDSKRAGRNITRNDVLWFLRRAESSRQHIPTEMET